VKIARPLPECRQCETPTQRAAFLENGGLCSPCLELLASTVRMPRLPPSPDQLAGDHTVMVEGYRPPVPGQLTIGDDT
jgi:hypothetical protein